MTENEKRNLLIEHLTRRLAKATKRAERQVLKLTTCVDAEEKPRCLVHELTWSDDLFAAAAEADVLERVHGALVSENSKATFESVRDHAFDQALGKAARGQTSTSACSNMVSRYEAAAWCEVAQLVLDVERGWI